MTKIYYQPLKKIVADILSLETDNLLIVIDKNVAKLYKADLQFISEDKKITTLICEPGEDTKKFCELEKSLEYFLKAGIHRKSHLIAIGGGATSDFGGLVSSMLLRGISWSVVSTTLLSMVDASIGGKVAINSDYGKNLIGAFHSPDNVWMSDEFFESQSKEEILSGKGEIIKYAFLSEEIYKKIMSDRPLIDIVKACAEFKEKITNEDFKEASIRKILNFGHTFGHAFEKIHNISHGIAVIWGIYLILKVYNSEKYIDILKEVADKLDLPIKDNPWGKEFNINNMMSYLTKDKKIVNNKEVELILIKAIGTPYTNTVSFEKIISDIKKAI